jgi:hypothetical protein
MNFYLDDQQKNKELSFTSPDIFVPKQQKPLHLHKTENKTPTSMLIFIFLKIFITFMFIYIIFTSEKYKTLYESDTNIIFVWLNVLISYIQIGITIWFLVNYNKYINSFIKNDIQRACYTVFLFIFFIYIISTLRFTYILINMDEYKDKKFCFLTNYYTLMQVVSIIYTFSYYYK